MPIEPPNSFPRQHGGWALWEIVKTIINRYGPAAIYPEKYLDGWIKENVINPNGGWYELVEEAALDLVSNVGPGGELYAAMEHRIKQIKGRPVRDEERYG